MSLHYRIRTPSPNSKTVFETNDIEEVFPNWGSIWNEVDITGGIFNVYDVGICSFSDAIHSLPNYKGQKETFNCEKFSDEFFVAAEVVEILLNEE